ncbi:MAG: hypothetical protein ACM3PP_13550 [Candidatus Saccharibacteria bacterium]
MAQLNEFSLDLPYIPDQARVRRIMVENECEYQEAMQADYAERWQGIRQRFLQQTYCITSFYERCFEGRNADCWKIVGQCVPEITDSRIIYSEGVCYTQVIFPIDRFFQSSNYDKKVMALNGLKTAIDIIVSEKNWDELPFDIAYSMIVKREYKNSWMWKRPVQDPNKELTAEIVCEMETKSLDVFVVVRKVAGEEIQRAKLASVLPDDKAYLEHLGRLEWESRNRIVLINKKGTDKISVSI